MASLRRLLTSLLASAALAVPALSQGKAAPTCSFMEVKYQQANGVPEILVIFNSGPQQGNEPVDWEVIDATSGSAFHLKTPALKINLTGADLWLPASLDTSHKYFLTAFGLSGCDPDKPPISNVVIAKPEAPTPPSVPSPHPKQAAPTNAGHGLTVTPSKARTDSDLYFSGLLSGATGQNAAYTADIKTQLDYVLKQASEKTPELALLPSFDFTASTNPKQDGNSVTFGTSLRIAFADKVVPLSFLGLYTVLEPGVAAQSDPNFRVVEPMFRLPIYAIPKVFSSGPFIAYLQPTFGVEAGGSTKMPSAADYSPVPATLPTPETIFRPFAGGSLYVNVDKKSKAGGGTKTIFSSETDYINRWPIFAEPVFSQTSTGKLTLLGIGSGPRGYVTTKLERDLGSYFSIAAEYDYGGLPPLYTKVDNKYSLSFTYKAALKAGAGAK
jgi:hypothetical protein